MPADDVNVSELRQNIALFQSPYHAQFQVNEDCGSLWDRAFGPSNDLPWEKSAYIDSETNELITYAELKKQALCLAYTLRNELQLTPDDCLLLHSPNSIHWPVLFWACQAANVTISFSNPEYTVRELVHQANDPAVKVVVTDPEVAEVAVGAAREIRFPTDRLFFLHPRDTSPSIKSIWSLVTGKQFQTSRMSKEEARTHVAYRCWSSGTSGLSKGVDSTNFNAINVIEMSLITSPDMYSRDDIVICSRPLFHAAGLFVHVLVPTILGSKTFLIRKYNFEKWLKLAHDNRVTRLDMAPPQALSLLKSPLVDKYDFTSVKCCRCGAAPFSADTHERLEKRIGCRLLGGYGMTEVTTVATHDRPETRKIGFNGPLIAGLEGRVVNGELWLRGPNVMRGYHNNPKATSEAFAEGGWYRTGDIVYVEDGHIKVLDRIKELIKYKGFQVAPAELEGVLASRSDISEAAVVAFEDPELETELPRAFVLLKDRTQASEQKAKEIIEWSNEQLADFKRLRGGIVFVDTIPKNPTAKIMRRVLRERKGDTVYGTNLFKRRTHKL